MHELGLLIQTAETVTRAARENGIEHVTGVLLDLGEASGVLPELFTELFPVVQERFPVLAGAELKLNRVPSKALCLDCSAVYAVMKYEGRCPRCSSREKKIIGGQDVVIREIQY